MRVFLTGATGFVGTAITRELQHAGHSVIGLARSDAAAASLAAAGATPHRGDLQDLQSLRRGAEAADAVIHAGFIHDFSRFKENCEIDRCAIEALGATLAGSARPLIVTSGTALVASPRLATEDMVPPAVSHNPRVSEQAAAKAAESGARINIVRLPPSVHGDGDHGFVPILIRLAREKGVSAYIGDGANRWPAVHRHDAAKLYRLVLEKGIAGSRYHGAAENGISFRVIAQVIGRRLGLPVVSKSTEEAADHFGWFTHFAGIDNPTSSEETRQQLGWQPTEPGLIADIDRPAYFEN